MSDAEVRLINANSFKRFLQALCKAGAPYECVIQLLDKEPTAYNVDNVVKELACNSRFIDDINEHNIKCISCVIGQKTAIEIVRKGGVE